MKLHISDSRWLPIAVFVLLLPIVLSHSETIDTGRELAALATRYSITIETSGSVFPIELSSGTITGKSADWQEVRAYAPLLLEEMSVYPASFVRQTNLKRIVLCKELAFAGQLRTAIPDFVHDTLYLDVVRGASIPLYLNKVFHHEFYHIVDWKDDGKLYSDERWAALNRENFSYGTGGENAQHLSDTSLLTKDYPGFLNHYSTTGVEEDKAELFTNLVVEPGYVASRMADDPVLRAKVECLKDQLQTFCDDIDADFWTRAAYLKHPTVSAP